MPKKPGNGGHGLENYDPNTGKYVEDGFPNKYYDNPSEESKAQKLFGLDFENKNFYNTFKLPQRQLDYIKQHPYFKGFEMQTVPLQKLVEDNNLDNPDELSDRNIADLYIFGLDSTQDSPIRGIMEENGKIRIADGRHRVYALYKSGYDSIEMPIKKEKQNFESKVINTKKTGMSYYDQLIPGHHENDYMAKFKNLRGEIVKMSPNEYYETCAKDIFGHGDVEKLKEQRRQDQDSSNLMAVLEQGNQLDMPMINYAYKGQEGLHRMMVLGDKYGWDKKFPVLKVDYDDIDYEKKIRNNQINKALENVQDDIKEERVYNKESFIKQLEKHLNWNFTVEDKGNHCVITDGMVEKEVNYPVFDDDLDFEDLNLDEDFLSKLGV